MVTNTWAFCFVLNGYVYDQALIVFRASDAGAFAVLQSTIHFVWADEEKLTMRTDNHKMGTEIPRPFDKGFA